MDQVGVFCSDGMDDLAGLSDDPGGCQLLKSPLRVPGGAHRHLDAPFKLLAVLKGEGELFHLWEERDPSR